MFTLNTLLTAFEENGKLCYEGEHYESGELVWTGDLWRLWPTTDESRCESVKQNRLHALMEKKGWQLRFYDEIITDMDGKAHESQPSSYSWTPTWRILESCEVWSKQNALDDIEKYVEVLMNEDVKNRYDRWDIDFSEHGFTRFDYAAESGFHHGQTDTPESVKEMIEKEHGADCDIVFSIDSTGQFDVHFSAWYRKSE